MFWNNILFAILTEQCVRDSKVEAGQVNDVFQDTQHYKHTSIFLGLVHEPFLQSRKKYLEQSNEIKQNWTGPKNFYSISTFA